MPTSGSPKPTKDRLREVFVLPIWAVVFIALEDLSLELLWSVMPT
jgi:hypothetical protein